MEKMIQESSNIETTDESESESVTDKVKGQDVG